MNPSLRRNDRVGPVPIGPLPGSEHERGGPEGPPRGVSYSSISPSAALGTIAD
jgi:hypothetical protein